MSPSPIRTSPSPPVALGTALTLQPSKLQPSKFSRARGERARTPRGTVWAWRGLSRPPELLVDAASKGAGQLGYFVLLERGEGDPDPRGRRDPKALPRAHRPPLLDQPGHHCVLVAHRHPQGETGRTRWLEAALGQGGHECLTATCIGGRGPVEELGRRRRPPQVGHRVLE